MGGLRQALLVNLIAELRPGGGIVEGHLGKGLLLLVCQRADNAAEHLGTPVAQQAVDLIDLGGVLHHRFAVEASAGPGDVTLELTAERLDQWKTLLHKFGEHLFLFHGQRNELRLLCGSQDI